MNPEPAKGTRDFLPEEKIIRDKLVNSLKKVFEIYGYSPAETPIIEKYEIITAKFAAGEESDAAKEIFKVTDQGGRALGLRFDLTVPLARLICNNPTLKMPFKRYEIGRTYRNGPIKLGRYREFWQCDVDVIGCREMTADAEIILLALDAFKNLALDAFIEVNNRKLLQGILLQCDAKENMLGSIMVSIDKLKKQGQIIVAKELEEKGLSENIIEKIIDFITISGTNKQIITELKNKLKNPLALEGLKEIEEMFAYLDKSESDDVKLNIGLARGLAYYTGTVFEGYFKDSEITSSICGGGRYDNLINLYMDSEKQIPAVGISFGVEPITEAMKLIKNEKQKTVTKVYIIPIKTAKESFEVAKVLRENGIKTDIDLLGRGISKNLDYANALGIPFVIFVGKKELGEGKLKLRDMVSGEEELLGIEEVVQRLK